MKLSVISCEVMNLRIRDRRGYSESYLAARLKIDDLCDRIRKSGITEAVALDSYSHIADNFLKEESQKAELFSMVYESRIKRLIRQFLAGAGE